MYFKNQNGTKLGKEWVGCSTKHDVVVNKCLNLRRRLLVVERAAPLPIGGGGGDSNIKMPGCVCWGSENVPILKDA